MLVVNFGHPLNSVQLAELHRLLDGQSVSQVLDVKVQVDMESSFADQAVALVAAVGWTPFQWQQNRFVVVPPGLATISLALVAVMHGRCGYFPAVVRLKPVAGTPPVFMPQEILDLAGLREEARKQR